MELGFISVFIIVVVGLYLLNKTLNNGTVRETLDTAETAAKAANKVAKNALYEFEVESKVTKAKFNKKTQTEIKELGKLVKDDEILTLLEGL